MNCDSRLIHEYSSTFFFSFKEAMHISFHGKNVCGAVAWPPQRVHAHLNKQGKQRV